MERSCTIYYTSDVHGYLEPTDYHDRSEQPAGLLNCISHFEKDGNTLVLDGGDTLQGSPMAAYLSSEGRGEDGEPIAEVFNAGGYDGVTLGNHDFNFGSERLRRHLRALNGICICANVVDETGGLGILRSHIFTMENGLRVGVTGVVTDFVNVWEQPRNLEKLRVTDAFEAAAVELKALKRNADVTVCIYHGGYECDLNTGAVLSASGENVACRICRELDYDVLLTAHQHMPVAGRWLDGTYTLQVAANAVEYARLRIRCLPDGVLAESEICPAGERHKEQPYGKLKPLEDAVQDWLDKDIGRLKEEIPAASKLEMGLYGSGIADFFNQVQLEYSGAELSCVGLGNSSMALHRCVTMRDLVKVYPFANTLVVLEVGEDELRKALERCGEYFTVKDGSVCISDVFLKPKVEHYNYDFFAGISYTFDLRRPVGERVTSLLYDGKPLGGRSFSLCMSDYRASGTGGYEVYRGCRVLKRLGREVPQLALEYLKRHQTVEIREKAGISVVW